MSKSDYLVLPDRIFVTGIGTGVGKTIASAALCKLYGYDYWKPIQSGDLDHSDSDHVRILAPHTTIHPEQYRLNHPMSPHASAALDGIKIRMNDFIIPDVEKLCVEGAGGILVPISEDETMLDLIKIFFFPVALIIRDYLGCINHSLMSREVLKLNNIPIAAVVYNGNFTIPAIYLPELADN